MIGIHVLMLILSWFFIGVEVGTLAATGKLMSGWQLAICGVVGLAAAANLIFNGV